MKRQLGAQGRRTDYILVYKNNKPLVIVEAKDTSHNLGDGIQLALDYSEMTDEIKQQIVNKEK